MSKERKCVIKLKGVNTYMVEQNYDIHNVDRPYTNIADIMDEKPKSLTFYNESRRPFTCNVSMLDVRSNAPISGNYRPCCFWDRHPFIGHALGCPIRYVSNRVSKSYFSEISKDTYIIKENVSGKRSAVAANEHGSKAELSVEHNDYYETDGVFCSFQCMLAFINDNRHNELYARSEILMNKMIFEIFGTSSKINPAPHWRQLIPYGGDKTIDGFRNEMNKEYAYHGQIQRRVLFEQNATLFEENVSIAK